MASRVMLCNGYTSILPTLLAVDPTSMVANNQDITPATMQIMAI